MVGPAGVPTSCKLNGLDCPTAQNRPPSNSRTISKIVQPADVPGGLVGRLGMSPARAKAGTPPPQLKAAWVRLPNEVARDTQLNEQALVLLAYRATHAGDYVLNERALLRRRLYPGSGPRH